MATTEITKTPNGVATATIFATTLTVLGLIALLLYFLDLFEPLRQAIFGDLLVSAPADARIIQQGIARDNLALVRNLSILIVSLIVLGSLFVSNVLAKSLYKARCPSCNHEVNVWSWTKVLLCVRCKSRSTRHGHQLSTIAK